MKINLLINLRRFGRWPLPLLLGMLLSSNFMALSVQAAGVVGTGKAASCTESAFNTALSGGGSVTFNCGGLATITVTEYKQISVDTTIDGGGLITLNGSNSHFFQVYFAHSLTLQNITLTNGTSNIAGAIENFGTTTIVKSRLVNNLSSANAGAVVNYGHLVLTDSTLSNNQAANAGGAIYNDAGTVEATGCLFADNKVTGPTGKGGALANNLGTITLNQAALINNSTVGPGGGIYSIDTFTLTNVTLSGNQSTNDGGGGLFQGGGIGSLNFVTVVGNSAAFGAGVYNDGLSSGTLYLQNTLLSNNTVGDCDGVLISLGNNLSSDTHCGGAFIQMTDQINTPALLEPLANNGGRTPTYLPQAGSPAIDAGQCVEGVTVDQRGALRPLGAACDMGAAEYGAQVDQTIQFGPISNKTLSDSSFVITATSSSTLPVDFSSNTPSICTVSGGPLLPGWSSATIILSQPGACTLVAQQPGNLIVNPALTVTQTFNVVKNNTFLPLILRQ